MTCRYLDSHDHYTTAMIGQKCSIVNGPPAIGAGIGRNGTAGMRMAPWDYLGILFDAQPTWIVGWWFNAETMIWTDTSPIAYLFDGGSPQCSLHLEIDGTLTFWRGGTLLVTSGVVITPGVFYLIEWQCTIGSVSGAANVWVNGVNVLSFTGNTQSSGNATASTVYRYGPPNGVGSHFVYDDYYIFDGTGVTNNSPLGQWQIDYQGPTGDGEDAGWSKVGADATKWQTLAENPPNTAKVVSTSTVNASYTAAFSAPVETGAIKSVQIVMSAQRSGLSASTMRPLTRHAGVDTPGVSVTPANGTYGFFLQQFDTNPGNTLSWEKSDIATDQFGIKYIGPTNVIAVNQFSLEILATIAPVVTPSTSGFNWFPWRWALSDNDAALLKALGLGDGLLDES